MESRLGIDFASVSLIKFNVPKEKPATAVTMAGPGWLYPDQDDDDVIAQLEYSNHGELFVFDVSTSFLPPLDFSGLTTTEGARSSQGLKGAECPLNTIVVLWNRANRMIAQALPFPELLGQEQGF